MSELTKRLRAEHKRLERFGWRGRECMSEAASALDAAEAALVVFARLADIGEEMEDGQSISVNITRCREARAALAKIRGK